MVDFPELLQKRRSIRDFQDKDVPPELVREIIQDACLAPSSGNGQPWKFIVIHNKGWIRRLSEESKNLLNEPRLRLMKKAAYLINTARGAIVDEMALVRMLQERAIAGAALDVFVEEPLPKNHPITQLDNVVLTPHLGWPTDSGFEGFAENAVTNILDYMQGKLTRALNSEALSHRGKRN